METNTALPLTTAYLRLIDTKYWGVTYQDEKVGFITEGTNGFLAHVYNELGTYTKLLGNLIEAAVWIKNEAGANYLQIPTR